MNDDNKIHSKRTVLPFSWESKPGMSIKEFHTSIDDTGGSDDFPVIKLPPPPGANLQPPPASLRSNSLRKSLRKNEDDPFLIAYIECTKSGRDDRKWAGVVSKGGHHHHHGSGFGIMKNLSIFSCKHSASNAIDNSIVRVSQLPRASKSQRFFKKGD